jgi:tripartite-type tricarboxylate transporter receptor subunit TctC
LRTPAGSDGPRDQSRISSSFFAPTAAAEGWFVADSVFYGFATGVDILHVPFRGVGAALTAIMSGEVQLAVIPVPVALPQVRAGKVRAYAITSERRSASAPEIPTAAQAGLPAFESTTWFAMFAPARTPAPIITRLNRDMVDIIGSPAMATWLNAQGAEPVPGTPAELAAFVAAEIAKWARVVKAAGITPE